MLEQQCLRGALFHTTRSRSRACRVAGAVCGGVCEQVGPWLISRDCRSAHLLSLTAPSMLLPDSGCACAFVGQLCNAEAEAIAMKAPNAATSVIGRTIARGKVMQPLRVALTGKATAPEMADTCARIGQAQVSPSALPAAWEA